ncbi:O-methyltransferase [Undibacterium sp. Ren11W]|uniref:O-methyltransferase n=1 Tax=Undibacterium sp. Ren11W TaxID=3413045 RepID=UPI003BF3936C
MNQQLQNLLTELEAFGGANDASTSDRSQRMLNITHDTGLFLSFLVRTSLAKRVLEIGTSNGYSTLWLAQAAKSVGGKVTTVELSDTKVELARTTFGRSELADVIDLFHGEAGQFLASSDSESFDFIFLDSERSEYLAWWPEIKRVLRRGGSLVVDNATSHAQELAEFIALVSSLPDYVSVVVPIGNGEFIATHSSD